MKMTGGVRWALFWAAVMLAILVPFFLFGASIQAWTESFVKTGSPRRALAVVALSGLLATDVVLPIPSSLVSTALGYLAGFAGGTAASTVGMEVSCLVAYIVGRRIGRPIAHRTVGQKELATMEALSHRFGDWVIVVARPVPVLAEMSVLAAGMGCMPIGRFVLISSLSNLGISAVYAAVGAWSASVNSFLLAFAGAVVVPGLAMLLTRRTHDPQSVARKGIR